MEDTGYLPFQRHFLDRCVSVKKRRKLSAVVGIFSLELTFPSPSSHSQAGLSPSLSPTNPMPEKVQRLGEYRLSSFGQRWKVSPPSISLTDQSCVSNAHPLFFSFTSKGTLPLFFIISSIRITSVDLREIRTWLCYGESSQRKQW